MAAPFQLCKKIRINAMTFAHLVDGLLIGGSLAELAEYCGLHYVTTCRYVRELRKRGVIHVESWQKDSRGYNTIPVYLMGRGKDAKKVVLTRAERQQRQRDKKKALSMIHAMAA